MSRFDDAYAAGTPPWDIGRAQPVFLDALARGQIRGRVIDLGCGTGDNTIGCAAAGLDVLGVDFAPLAIERAKARAAGTTARFAVADVLELGNADARYDTAIDCAVFHVFADDERARYLETLTTIVVPGGHYLMLVLSDREPTDWGGPRRLRKDEIEAAFAQGWTIRSLDAVKFETNIHPDGAHAWFADLERVI